MRLSRLALAPVVAVLFAACSGGGGASSPSQAAPPSEVVSRPPAASPSGAAPSSAATRIEVRLTDALKIEPADMTVPAGVPVTFVVTNAGQADHEFYLGDEEAQADHEQEMASMGGMTHDEPEGIAVDPGETKELTYTFEAPGHTLAGCHVTGHYDGGMKATITIIE